MYFNWVWCCKSHTKHHPILLIQDNIVRVIWAIGSVKIFRTYFLVYYMTLIYHKDLIPLDFELSAFIIIVCLSPSRLCSMREEKTIEKLQLFCQQQGKAFFLLLLFVCLYVFLSIAQLNSYIKKCYLSCKPSPYL